MLWVWNIMVWVRISIDNSFAFHFILVGDRFSFADLLSGIGVRAQIVSGCVEARQGI